MVQKRVEPIQLRLSYDRAWLAVRDSMSELTHADGLPEVEARAEDLEAAASWLRDAAWALRTWADLTCTKQISAE